MFGLRKTIKKLMSGCFLGTQYWSLVILKTALKSYHVHEKCLFHLFMYSALMQIYLDFVA